MNIKKLMKQAQQMQDQMQTQLKELTVEGSAGGGMVKVTLNGHKDLLKITLEPEILRPEEREMVEDLVLAAFKDAQEKVDLHLQGLMGALTGGMGIG